jgi:ribosomal protein L21
VCAQDGQALHFRNSPVQQYTINESRSSLEQIRSMRVHLVRQILCKPLIYRFRTKAHVGPLQVNDVKIVVGVQNRLKFVIERFRRLSGVKGVRGFRQFYMVVSVSELVKLVVIDLAFSFFVEVISD